MGKIDSLREQHPEFNMSLIDIFKKYDPSGTNKYIEFLIRHVKKDKPTDQSLIDHLMSYFFEMNQIETLHTFEKHLTENRIKNKDISKITSFSQMEKENEVADELLRIKQAEKECKRIFEDSTYFILQPFTYECARIYGANTKWCITIHQHWSDYFPNYRIFMIINKVTNEKYAISVNHEDQSDITAWTQTDAEISPLKLPIPISLMNTIIDEININPYETQIKRLTDEDHIIDEYGCIFNLKDACDEEIRTFFNTYGSYISESFNKKLKNIIDKDENKDNNIYSTLIEHFSHINREKYIDINREKYIDEMKYDNFYNKIVDNIWRI